VNAKDSVTARVNQLSIITPVMRRFRAERMRQFAALFHLTPETRVLDVGGQPFNWMLCPVRPRVTLLNVVDPNYDVPDDMVFVRGDGRAMEYAEGAFDIVYSNSVIEHVGDWEQQRRFAAECARVGRSYYVQTPNRAFPVEPHVVAPFFHFLPRRWQRPLIRNWTLWGWFNRPDNEQATAWYDEVRLLSRTEMRALFPRARILGERFVGLTKSLIAAHVATA
jgi:hypothetical protein